jgi:hypothetical protein
MFVRKHKITTHKLSKPFHIRTADGSHSKDGKVTDFCMLIIKIDHRFMRGKFNITQLSECDDILLGYPWLAATSPDIDWARQTISMTPTPDQTHQNLSEEASPQKEGFCIRRNPQILLSDQSPPCRRKMHHGKNQEEGETSPTTP